MTDDTEYGEFQHKLAPYRRELQLGSAGDDVRYVQALIGDLAGKPDGKFGPKTDAGVRWYQQARGITSDGVVGDETWMQVLRRNERGEHAASMDTLRVGAKGSVVGELQRALNHQRLTLPRIPVDHVFGPRTEIRVKEIQNRHGLKETGNVTQETWKHLGY